MKKLNIVLSSLAGLAVASLIVASPAFAKGGESGGGGFFKNSPILLKSSIDADVSLLQSIPESVLSSAMPSSWNSGGWTKDRLISLIKNTCFEIGEFRKRDNLPLTFDYCTGDQSSPSCQNTACQASAGQGQYISALFPFFSAYESINPANPGYNRVTQTISVALIHEAVHLLGVGTSNDDDAEALAQKIMRLPHNPGIDLSLCQGYPQGCKDAQDGKLFDTGWLGGGYRDVIMPKSSSLTVVFHPYSLNSADCNDLGPMTVGLWTSESGDNKMSPVSPDSQIEIKEGATINLDLSRWPSRGTMGLHLHPSMSKRQESECSFSFDLIDDQGAMANLNYYTGDKSVDGGTPSSFIHFYHADSRPMSPVRP